MQWRFLEKSPDLQLLSANMPKPGFTQLQQIFTKPKKDSTSNENDM